MYGSPSGTVCQCCHPSVAVDRAGAIVVMFRNALDGSRDMYRARSVNGGKSFEEAQKVGQANLEAGRLPHGRRQRDRGREGPSRHDLAPGRDHHITREGDAEKSLGLGRNPTAVATKAGVYSAWTEGTAVRVKAREAEQPETLDEDGAFPAVAAARDGSAVVAWESKGSIVIRKVR